MADGVYKLFDKKDEGKVKQTPFVKFFGSCELKEGTERMTDEDAGRLFNHLDHEGEGFVEKEVFMNLIRKFMKVVKASVLTEEISIKSKAMRRLTEGEVLEVLTGPT